MSSTRLSIFICAILLAFWLPCRAQTCTGSLGDPVINETFGFGTSATPIGPPLPGSLTNLRYLADPCPNDGQYTIASITNGCFQGTWYTSFLDHTRDNPYGYMMVINASGTSDAFYIQKASGSQLCPNTTYEFAAWVMNLIVSSAATAGYIKPNLTFIIETADGRRLAPPYNTGNIPEKADWQQYGTFFTTPSDGADIVVKLINNAPSGRGNDILLDDITFKPCGPQINTGFNSATAADPKNLCVGDNASYLLTSSQTGYASPSYRWQVNKDDGQGFKDIEDATNADYQLNLTNAAEGKYQYRVGILATLGASMACRIYGQPLIVNVYPIPQPTLQPVTTVCAGQPLTLSATSATNGTNYEWTGPNGFTATGASPTVATAAGPSLEGIYTVKVISNGCFTTASTEVKVYPPINARISGPETICPGGAAQLRADGGSVYKWTPATGLNHDDVFNPVASPTTTTEYNVEIGNGACSEIRTVKVTVLPPITADAGQNFTLQEGDPAQLKGKAGGGNIAHYWTPAETVSDPGSLTPFIYPTESTIYTLHTESLDGCGTVTDDVFVRVYKKITIPNTFSPNGDGANDLWAINNLYTYPDALVRVYTRNGQQVYQSIGYAQAWAGTYNGKQLPGGVYYYVIDLKNNTPLRSGWVMLLR